MDRVHHQRIVGSELATPEQARKTVVDFDDARVGLPLEAEPAQLDPLARHGLVRAKAMAQVRRGGALPAFGRPRSGRFAAVEATAAVRHARLRAGAAGPRARATARGGAEIPDRVAVAQPPAPRDMGCDGGKCGPAGVLKCASGEPLLSGERGRWLHARRRTVVAAGQPDHSRRRRSRDMRCGVEMRRPGAVAAAGTVTRRRPRRRHCGWLSCRAARLRPVQVLAGPGV